MGSWIYHNKNDVKIIFNFNGEDYCSDMTRTILNGHLDKASLEIYQLVLPVNEAAIAAVKPGVTFA